MRLLALLVMTSTAAAAQLDVWIGTHQPRQGEAEGIYHLSFDDQTGKLSPAKLVAKQKGAGFLVRHPQLPILYSTGDGVSSWRITGNGADIGLEAVNSQPTGDGGAAHVAVDRTGRVLLSAQYGGGSVSSYPLDKEGSIGKHITLLRHTEPSGVVPDRQRSCHPHWVGTSPDNRFVLVPDLGADQIYIHRLDAKTGELAPHDSVTTPPGSGPRHFAFHPSGKAGYVSNEIDVSISAFEYDPEGGKLAISNTAPTVTREQKERERHNSTSEVRVHPSGKFVYVANRGHDTISVFSIDDSIGELSLVEQEPIRGSWPRNFNLDPSGRWLLAAGRDSNTLAVFAVDPGDGSLQFTQESAQVPAPICVVIE